MGYPPPQPYAQPGYGDPNLGMQTYPTPYMSTPYSTIGQPMPNTAASGGSKTWVWVSLGFVIGLAIMLAVGFLTCTTCVCVSM